MGILIAVVGVCPGSWGLPPQELEVVFDEEPSQQPLHLYHILTNGRLRSKRDAPLPEEHSRVKRQLENRRRHRECCEVFTNKPEERCRFVNCGGSGGSFPAQGGSVPGRGGGGNGGGGSFFPDDGQGGSFPGQPGSVPGRGGGGFFPDSGGQGGGFFPGATQG